MCTCMHAHVCTCVCIYTHAHACVHMCPPRVSQRSWHPTCQRVHLPAPLGGGNSAGLCGPGTPQQPPSRRAPAVSLDGGLTPGACGEEPCALSPEAPLSSRGAQQDGARRPCPGPAGPPKPSSAAVPAGPPGLSLSLFLSLPTRQSVVFAELRCAPP